MTTSLELVAALFPGEIDMVEFVRSGGDLPVDVAGRIAPDLDVEFLPEALGGGIGGVGLAGMVESWREWLAPYESYVITREKLEELGEDEVLILVRVNARTHRDGVAIEHTPAAIATIREGVLVRIRFYLDRDLARADAGDGGG